MPFVAPPLIESERVRLRLACEADLPDLLAINGDPEVARHLGWRPWQSMAEAEAWFARIHAMQQGGTAIEWVIEEKSTGVVIGRCTLFQYEEGNAQAMLGYVLKRSHWGRGLMRETLSALLGHAFGEMGLRRIEAHVEAANKNSLGLLRRLGFRHEGTLRERWITEDEATDAEIFGLLRSEFAAGPR